MASHAFLTIHIACYMLSCFSFYFSSVQFLKLLFSTLVLGGRAYVSLPSLATYCTSLFSSGTRIIAPTLFPLRLPSIPPPGAAIHALITPHWLLPYSSRCFSSPTIWIRRTHGSSPSLSLSDTWGDARGQTLTPEESASQLSAASSVIGGVASTTQGLRLHILGGARMLQKRWKGCIFFSLAFLLCNASGVVLMASENSPSEFAKIVQSKQTRQARVCGPDPALLSSLAGIGDAEVMVTIPNEQLEHVAEFREEADLWVAANVARFVPVTRITHVLAGDDVLATSSPGSSAYFLVPAMRNLRSALAAAGLGGRVKVSSALSGEALADPAWSGVVAHVLRFLESSGSPLFLKSRPLEEASDAKVDGAYAAMRALGVSRVPVIAADLAAGGGGVAVVPYYYYKYGYPGAGGQRRSLATGTFCVALQNADPAALQAGLNWACGPGHADCSAIQPGGACYQQNNLPALASYAYNDYYQKMASTGATCSFNATATTTTNDPSSGSCVFAGSSTAGGSNSSVPVGASPPTSLSPPTGFTPPVGSSPPSSSEFTPPSGFTPPAGGGFGPSFGSPPGSFNGTGSFGPSGTLNPYNGGSRGLSRAGFTALSAAAVAVLLVSMDAM